MEWPEHTMWDAVVRCDGDYDGKFYYAVRTTGICCRPSCRSRTPVRDNVCFFARLADALGEGYRPCKRCRPDLLEPPGDRDVVRDAQAVIARRYTTGLTLDGLAREVGMSRFHLQRTYKREAGESPAASIAKLRVANAKELLRGTALSVTEIAHEVGFKSASHFSVAFGRQVGCSPVAYRAARRKEADDRADFTAR
ncbi:bifunctional transcriptional activator/DNA repair enzyme AdaA [Paenibacillus cymbidii]|uniref:bifunctional transcriptional activator/DNA repair enzyme AdaA n=1 Tax=Paenibacillus cymbidii TaxID=1639034 RepID=UPI001436C3E2|nr:Ada metal-binding domain-containing protein [Paenibacillus cymbidii]